MKLASFEKKGEERFGSVRNGAIADLTGRLPSGAVTLAEAIRSDGLDAIRSAADRADAGLALGDVRLLPPVPRPGKIVCIGLNYKTHIAESGHPAPAKPMLFARFANSVVGHGEPLVRPKVSHSFDFEG